MKLRKETLRISVTTTPKELRALADKMEREFPQKKIGQSCMIDLIQHEDVIIEIHGQQSAFERYKKSNFSDWV